MRPYAWRRCNHPNTQHRMPELRWILIGFAIVLLAAIYLWGRRTSVPGTRREPALDVMSMDAYAPVEGEPRDAELDEENSEGAAASEHREPVVSVPVVANTGAYPRTIVRENETPPTSAQSGDRGSWRGRIEPTFSDALVAEESVGAEPQPESPQEGETATAPTLSSAETPAPKRIERRKILALRLAASPHRYEGARLLEVLEAESLQHGKYQIFHRLHDDGASIFCVASMVEPGTFELESMGSAHYPGVTLFAQLPGPVPGMHALNELVACARRLQERLGGTLQDDRGVPLTVHRIERMRQEVREFERPQSQTSMSHTSSSRRP